MIPVVVGSIHAHMMGDQIAIMMARFGLGAEGRIPETIAMVEGRPGTCCLERLYSDASHAIAARLLPAVERRHEAAP